MGTQLPKRCHEGPRDSRVEVSSYVNYEAFARRFQDLHVTKGDGLYFGLFEPSGGTAPDIAGMGIANPIAQILSTALLLRFALGLEKEAQSIEAAVKQAIEDGLRTGDIFTNAPGTKKVNTAEMGAAIIERLK